MDGLWDVDEVLGMACNIYMHIIFRGCGPKPQIYGLRRQVRDMKWNYVPEEIDAIEKILVELGVDKDLKPERHPDTGFISLKPISDAHPNTPLKPSKELQELIDWAQEAIAEVEGKA